MGTSSSEKFQQTRDGRKNEKKNEISPLKKEMKKGKGGEKCSQKGQYVDLFSKGDLF